MTDDVSTGGKIISIHALLAESDGSKTYNRHKTPISIHALLAESDLPNAVGLPVYCNFYPRSPCGERHCSGFAYVMLLSISIHALLAESDVTIVPACGAKANFYPRSPCGERRLKCDFIIFPRDFYPRSPCGERQSGNPSWIPFQQFLSTLSLRRATYWRNNIPADD